MRTHIVIDDERMDAVMFTGDDKTKREAVETGWRLIQRRKAYAAIRAARGTLHWNDSDESWAPYRAEQAQSASDPSPAQAARAMHEATTAYPAASAWSACEKANNETCILYAVDDLVVWKKNETPSD